MKMQSNVKKEIKLVIVIIGLGITFAGCQKTAEKTSQQSGNIATSHSNSVMPDNTVRPPQSPKSNVELPGKNEVQIVIENFVFNPADITVPTGTKVTWINKDEAPHTATSTDTAKTFNSGGLDTDDKFSFVFNDKGDYPYFCALHPQMKAQIKVK